MLMTSTELGFPENITCEGGEETSLRSSTWSLCIGFWEATLGGGWEKREERLDPLEHRDMSLGLYAPRNAFGSHLSDI